MPTQSLLTALRGGRLSVPHSWNRVGQYEAQTGVTPAQHSIDKKQGVGWYRLDLKAPIFPLGAGPF
jgi:hypothetical protein